MCAHTDDSSSVVASEVLYEGNLGDNFSFHTKFNAFTVTHFPTNNEDWHLYTISKSSTGIFFISMTKNSMSSLTYTLKKFVKHFD